MKIPKKIHYAGKDYEIKEIEDLGGGDHIGSTKMNEHKIYLEKDLGQAQKEETLLHEIIHIAYQHSGKLLTEEQEEHIVDAWSMNLYGILKDNDLLK